MIKALDTALDIARDMKLPVFPCDEKPDEKGKISKRPSKRLCKRKASRPLVWFERRGAFRS